ncbi:hypothetical protein DCC39_13195 [Pueribacillus theae]|uniref:Aspartyl-phosphate phosphatase Spo0E family protein n=1 Tax=Pueribacillus theae TaxID=2171751 RepID=A0A2U1JW63_9BACI|nr:aspartyl-phosphate phosphatase Spo0E family protein [Pueribacillus theae]PWA09447.1 hypothetical protein DCC39_13195 [Pueribacillus theae]
MNNVENDVKQKLLHEIKLLRDEMIFSGVTKGLNHDETLELSRKLDQALNIYNSLKYR